MIGWTRTTKQSRGEEHRHDDVCQDREVSEKSPRRSQRVPEQSGRNPQLNQDAGPCEQAGDCQERCFKPGSAQVELRLKRIIGMAAVVIGEVPLGGEASQ